MLHYIRKWFGKTSPIRNRIPFKKGIYSESRYCSRRSAYQNPTVYRCVQYIATSVASVKLIVQSKNQDHPLSSLINQPNPQQTQTEFLETAVSNYLLTGNIFILASFDVNHQPKSLNILRTEDIEVVPGEYGKPKGYVYNIDGKKTYIEYETNSIKEILHIKSYNPYDDFVGYSPLDAASNALKQIELFHTRNEAILLNACRPSGVFYYKGDIPLDQASYEKLVDDLKEAMHNSNPLVLDKQIEWKPLAASEALDYSEATLEAAKSIAQVYNIPPSLIGIVEPKFSNYAESRKQFWQDAVMPITKKIAEMLHFWLTPLFAENPSIAIDMNTAPSCAFERQ